MRIERRNTTQGQSPYAGIDFRLTTSEIRNPDGSVVFRLENVEVPEFWSQVASDVLAQKYFRKAGVAARLKKVEEETVPSGCGARCRHRARRRPARAERYVSELFIEAGVRTPRRLLDLLGRKGNYFDRRRRSAFYDELRFMLPSIWCAEFATSGSTPACTGPTARGPPGPLLRRPLHRQADPIQNPPTRIRSRTPAHPGRQ